jgi:hypothetical protein
MARRNPRAGGLSQKQRRRKDAEIAAVLFAAAPIDSGADKFHIRSHLYSIIAG